MRHRQWRSSKVTLSCTSLCDSLSYVDVKGNQSLTHIESFRARARLTPRSFGADLSEGGATLFSASLQINISHIHTVTSSPRIERYIKTLKHSTSSLEALEIAQGIQHNRSSEPSVLQRGVDPEKKRAEAFRTKHREDGQVSPSQILEQYCHHETALFKTYIRPCLVLRLLEITARVGCSKDC